MTNKPSKIYILGASGSGKTFLAKELSKKLNIPHYDSDEIFFVKKFSKIRPKKKRKILVDNLLKKKTWIFDARGTDWDRHAMLNADMIILLQTPLSKRIIRILKRYNQRKKSQELEENFREVVKLLKYTSDYRFTKVSSGYKQIKDFLKKNSLDYIVIKSKKQLNEFLEDFLKK